ncbi:hypothetical protein [Providencia rettgeri]|uniref:hypothetical protein n=1 Tax=Providencia rettgeri TaxID=587 RepID=UPI0034E098CD
MAQNPINNQPKPQLSPYSTNEANLEGNKTGSNFKAFLKKITPSFISFFSLLFSCQNKHSAGKKKAFSEESFVIIPPINKTIPTRTISFSDDSVAKIPATQNEIIPKEGLTGNPRVDAARKVALQVIAQHKAQRAEKLRKNEADKLQKNNAVLIDNYDGLSNMDREKNHLINRLGCIILTHKEYTNSIGPLRIEGLKNEVNQLLERINVPDSAHDFLSQLHNDSLPTITSAFKKIAADLLKKSNNIDFKSPVSFNDLQACADAVKNKEDIIQQIKSNEQLKNKAPAILKNTDNRICKALDRLAPPPLALQLVIRFCALIANDEDTHRMSVKNLATIFAPHLTDTSSLNISTTKTPFSINEEEATNQLAISYIAALIHRERSPFHHA